MALAGGGQQGIARLLLVGEQRIEITFAHALGGEEDPRGLHNGDRLLHGDGTERQEVAAALGNRAVGRVLLILGGDDIRQEIHGIGETELVALDHVQRIVLHFHMQRADGAPCAADSIEGAAGTLLQEIGIAQIFARDDAGLCGRTARRLGQTDTAEWQGDAFADIDAGNIDQLQRTATEVADNAVRIGKAADNTKRGEIGLLLAGQHADFLAEDHLRLMDEIGAVFRLARGSGRQRIHGGSAGLLRKRPETMQRGQRALDARRIHAAGLGKTLAEAAHHLLVEQHGRRTAHALVDDEANRVGTDIHDRHRGNSRQTPLRFRFNHAVPVYFLRRPCQPAIAFGALDFKASPRPDRLGLVMK